MERLTAWRFTGGHDEHTNTPDDDPGPRRHRQDRSPGRRAARSARRARPHRLARRRRRRSTGTTARPGRRALRGVARPTSAYYPDLAVPRRGRDGRRRSPRWPSTPASAAGAAVRPRRGGGRSAPSGPCAPPAPSGRSCASQLVRAELQRGLPARRRARAARSRYRPATTAEPFVDADDIADVAVAALTDDGHDGELYELTGPRLLTFAEAVAEIAAATGRDVRYVPVPVEEYAPRLPSRACPRESSSCCATCSPRCSTAATPSSTDGVQRALGRAPRDFRDYARDAAATGVWNAEGPA